MSGRIVLMSLRLRQRSVSAQGIGVYVRIDLCRNIYRRVLRELRGRPRVVKIAESCGRRSKSLRVCEIWITLRVSAEISSGIVGDSCADGRERCRRVFLCWSRCELWSRWGSPRVVKVVVSRGRRCELSEVFVCSGGR